MQEEFSPGQKYKKYFKAFLPMILIFIIASTISLSIGLISADFLIFTIPIILIPVLFAFQIHSAVVEKGQPFSNKGFWGSLGRYFSGPFNGCYNVISSFFVSLLLSMLASVAFSIAFLIVAQLVSPSMQGVLENVVSMTQSGVSIDDVLASLSDSPEFVYMLISMQLFEGLFFTVMFTTRILGSAPYALILGTMGFGDKRGIKMIYNATKKTNRKLYSKNYLKFAWPLYPLIIIGFLAGIVLTLFVLIRNNMVFIDEPVTMFDGVIFSIPMGVLGSVLALTFYLPYFFFSVEEFAFDLIPVIRDTSVRIAKENLEELRRLKQINEEELRAYEEDIKKAQEADLNADSDDDNDIL